mgnify:CR=1 FL=1
MQYGFHFNGLRCTGCKTCMLACKDFHDLPSSIAFRQIYEYGGGTWQPWIGSYELGDIPSGQSRSLLLAGQVVLERVLGFGTALSIVIDFVGIDNARFKRPVEPGDQLVMETTSERARGGIYKFHAVGSVDGEVVCEADLMCTVRRVEILPYHTLGLFKWQNLGIPYPLDGVRVPIAEEVAAAEALLHVKDYPDAPKE